MSPAKLSKFREENKNAECRRFETLEEANAFVFPTEEPENKDSGNFCSCCGYEVNSEKRLIHNRSIQRSLKQKEDPIQVYVDGSHYGMGNQALGCGIGVFFHPDSLDNEGSPLSTVTNVGPRSISRAEIAAVLRALQILKKYNTHPVVIASDSESTIRVITRRTLDKMFLDGWKNSRKVKSSNWDLLEEIMLLLNRRGSTTKFKYVKAHSTDQYNNMVDWLAKQGAIADIGFQYLPYSSYSRR